MVCTTIVCAVNVPLTVKLSAEEAVKALVAQLDVPIKFPTNDPVNDPVIEGTTFELCHSAPSYTNRSPV